MRKTLSIGLDWYNTGQISYDIVMSEFRHVDGQTRCCVFCKSCSPMY